MVKFSFQCPYCNDHTTITDPNSFSNWKYIEIEESKKGKVWFKIIAVTCPNGNCRELYLHCNLTGVSYSDWYIKEWDTIQQRNLLPEYTAIILPDYIPEAIQEDYYESCRIKDLSPKASATLSRRCIQGMIRDFRQIKLKSNRLVDEIKAIEEKVDPDVREAIESVRKIWNIWAHMEQDINLIIDVDPEEAQKLIELIEMLIEEWYIARQKRKERTQKVIEIANQKKE